MKSFLMMILFYAFPNESLIDNSFVKNYYLELKNIHDPKTLNGKISENTIKEFKEFYISYSDKRKGVTRIEFIRTNKVELSLEYIYEGRVIKKLKRTNFIDKSHVKCETDYEKKCMTTKCFNEKGMLTLHELYFTRTKQYSVVTYDSTGAETLIEYGKY